MDAGKPDPIDDVFIDWLFRAYVGTREIHDVTSPEWALKGTRCLVVVNDGPSLHRGLLTRHEYVFPCQILVLPPISWEQARVGEDSLPPGFERVPVRSWPRRPEHDDVNARVERLTLANFRCFEQATFSFGAGANVLIGRNGSGKTAILDALALVLEAAIRPPRANTDEPLADWLLGSRDVRVARVSRADLATFEPQYPALIQASALLFGEHRQVGPLAAPHGGPVVADDRSGYPPFVVLADVVRWAVQDGFDVTLPLVAYYGTGRTWRGGPDRPSGPENLSRLAGYDGCLAPSTNLAGMRAWFRRMELVAYQDARTPAVLEASKRAILACLDGFDLVRFDARLDDLAARSTATGLLLPFAQLSDGQRNMLGMIADLAYRAATLNPHLGANAPEQTPGVVLIDEVDLHLHPAWQRRVLPDLMRAFPKVQFIVTTHSPQVLSTAPSGSVRLIDAEHRERSVDRTLGKDSNALLEDILGVPARPQQVKDDLEELARKIEDGESEAARALLVKLAAILGEDDAEVTSARWELAMAEGGDAAH